MKFDPISWIENHTYIEFSDLTSSFYSKIPECSAKSLYGVNTPLNPSHKDCFTQRASLFDFMCTIDCERIIDFGPGDGWPTIPLSAISQCIVGIDSSKQRIEICKKNAANNYCTNASFHCVNPGSPIPFPNDHFTGATASWSIEESPSIAFVLSELYRILKRGSTLRIQPVSQNFFNLGFRFSFLRKI